MCFSVPGKVLAIRGSVATVDFFGAQRTLRLALLDEPVAVGDYVMSHLGFAARRVPPEEVRETLEIYEQLFGDDANSASPPTATGPKEPPRS